MKFANLRKFKLSSVFVKGFLVIAVLEFCVVGILTYIYADRLSKNTMNEIMESNYDDLKRTGESLDAIIEQLSNCAYYISIDKDLRLLSISHDYLEDVDALSAVREAFGNYVNILGYVDSIKIYLEQQDIVIENNNVTSITNMTDPGWVPMYERAAEKRGEELYYLESRCKNGSYPFLLTMLYPIYNEHGKKTGAVVINVDLERLNETIGRSYKDQQKFYMLDDDGKLLYSSVSKTIKYPELLPKEWEMISGSMQTITGFMELSTEDGENIITMMEADFGGHYVLYSPREYYQESIELTKQYVIRNSIWTFLVCMVMSCVLAAYSYRPIRHIMNEIEMGENVRDEFIGEENKVNEIQYISNMIRSTKRRNAKLKLEVEEWIEKLGHAQVQALQSQINPHFLYNTLDSINWMVMERLGTETEVSQAIYSLAQLLRMSMKRSSYLIPLEEELEHARVYLELLDIRYPDKIKVHWEVGENLMAIKVVRLCLQPIIENAVMHGLKKRRYCGDIYIKGDLVNDVLVIWIEDNGIGMCREDCMRVNRELNTEYQMVDNHVGIRNVNQRMKILFGENYGIQLRPGDDGGLVVVLCFPGDIK